ncbi:LrgB family protein [Paenibacillus athensensis]|uniref:Murein hydrolase effector protein LrgB n=1 Tax=Paenibacillus athensensis TaxID=1967502 RepID=A0A4Y8Q6W5_9BACL|nr:LrgB family protein [Paenibacillus athensensis]MCD1257447.1 LrgB family protein [Paenibacillus athensensis]
MPNEFISNPLFGFALSVIAYAAANLLQQRWGWLHPLFTGSGCLIVVLLGFHIPYEAYAKGASLLTLLLGPATVALGVPIYKHAALIRRHLVTLAAALLAGCVTGIVGAAALVGLLGGSAELVLSMLPKSVSSPIAIEISRRLGGIPELTATLTVLTGLFGSMVGARVLGWLRIKDDVAVGLAVGVAAHGIGTGRMLRDSELRGSFAGLAMGVSGIVTALLFIPIYIWLRHHGH